MARHAVSLASFREFPGDRTESEWLDAFELLRNCLSDSLQTHVHLGPYTIDDFAGHAGAGGAARIRGKSPLPSVDCECDYWEGILCWSGSRGKSGSASAFVFPFRDGSVVQRRGRLADLEPGTETDELLSYRLAEGRFVCDGWIYEPDGWAEVAQPGSVYLQKLQLAEGVRTFVAGEPIMVDLCLPKPATASHCRTARASLVHVNRGRKSTNLAPWTARPPKPQARGALPISHQWLTTPSMLRLRLDEFSIRGGWRPGRYHLAVRIQNLHDPQDWSWSSDISGPVQISIVDRHGNSRGP